jgi:hypothetical protein
MKQQTGACKVELCRLRPKDDGRAALRARGFPHDRNARVRIETYVLAWNAKQKQEGQHQGPITAAYQRVLHAVLWHFTNYQTGLCFPSYETIAAKAQSRKANVQKSTFSVDHVQFISATYSGLPR